MRSRLARAWLDFIRSGFVYDNPKSGLKPATPYKAWAARLTQAAHAYLLTLNYPEAEEWAAQVMRWAVVTAADNTAGVPMPNWALEAAPIEPAKGAWWRQYASDLWEACWKGRIGDGMLAKNHPRPRVVDEILAGMVVEFPVGESVYLIEQVADIARREIGHERQFQFLLKELAYWCECAVAGDAPARAAEAPVSEE